MTILVFPAVIERGREGFGVFFPDLPGCTSGGDTVEQAERNAAEALDLYLGSMVEDGDAIPTPTPLDQIESDSEVDEVSRILVRFERPTAA